MKGMSLVAWEWVLTAAEVRWRGVWWETAGCPRSWGAEPTGLVGLERRGGHVGVEVGTGCCLAAVTPELGWRWLRRATASCSRSCGAEPTALVGWGTLLRQAGRSVGT